MPGETPAQLQVPHGAFMKSRGPKEWIWPPPDQWALVWGWVVLAFAGLGTSYLLPLFTGLTATGRICCSLFGLGMATAGISLIFFAKLPLYREHRFLTFGSKALPQERRAFYRWGYRCVIIGVILLGCLLLSSW